VSWSRVGAASRRGNGGCGARIWKQHWPAVGSHANMPIWSPGPVVGGRGSVGTGKKGYLEARDTCRMDTLWRKTEMIRKSVNHKEGST